MESTRPESLCAKATSVPCAIWLSSKATSQASPTRIFGSRPRASRGFIRYGAIPSQTKQLEPVVKEIISVAVDATPTHRYMPGLRLHLANALTLGSGRRALLEAIDIAAAAPAAPGVR